MSKYCGKCGTMLDDDAIVCGNCGENMPDDTSVGNNNFNSYTKKKSVNKIIIISIVVIALIGGLITFISLTFFGGRSYEEVIKTYISASIENPDAYELMTLIPDEVFEESIKDSDISRREGIEKIQESLEDTKEYFDDYGEWSITYEIVDVDASSKSEINILSDDCEDLFGFTVSDKKTISLELSINREKDGEKDTETLNNEIAVIKVNGDWYLWESAGSSIADGLF